MAWIHKLSATRTPFSLISEAIWLVGLFVAFAITRVNYTFPRLFVIALAPGLVLFFPIAFFLKVILASVVMYVLIGKLTDAQFFPDAVLAVGVANVFYVLVTVTVISKFS